MRDIRVWPYIVAPIALVAFITTTSALLWSVWPPLGVLPYAVYGYIGVWWNLKRCVCGHRFGRHSKFGDCWPCHRGWNPEIIRLPTGQEKLRSYPCRGPRRAA